MEDVGAEPDVEPGDGGRRLSAGAFDHAWGTREVPWLIEGSGVADPAWNAEVVLLGQVRADGGEDHSGRRVGVGGFGADHQRGVGGGAFGAVGDRSDHGPVDVAVVGGGFGERRHGGDGFGEMEAGALEEAVDGGPGGVGVAALDASDRRLFDAGPGGEGALGESAAGSRRSDQLSSRGHLDSVHASVRVPLAQCRQTDGRRCR